MARRLHVLVWFMPPFAELPPTARRAILGTLATNGRATDGVEAMFHTQITEAKQRLRSLATEAVEVWYEAGLEITECPKSLAPVCVPTYARPKALHPELSQIIPRTTPDQPQTAR